MWLNCLLICILLVCLYTDIKSRKIYNKLIYSGFLIALASHLVIHGWHAVLFSLIGCGVGLFILIIPYLLGGMGAGDVKLLALIGAIKGTVFVLQTSVYMALFGALLAILILLFRKGRLKALFLFLYTRMHRIQTPLFLDKKKMYPYGVAIAFGAFTCLIFGGEIHLGL